MERDECRNVLLQSNGRGGWLSVPCRRVFGVSPGCLVYLQHNLDMHVHARISTVLRTYVDFEAIPASAIRAQRRGKLGGFVRTASPARYYTLDKRRASAGSAVALGRNRDTGARKRQKKKRLPATVRR